MQCNAILSCGRNLPRKANLKTGLIIVNLLSIDIRESKFRKSYIESLTWEAVERYGDINANRNTKTFKKGTFIK